MQKIIIALFTLLIITSCENKKQPKSLQITGFVKGLKKGTLYIEKVQDSNLIVIDTIKINGNSNFISDIDLDEPQMLFLILDRGVSNSVDNSLAFFAEKGKINIETSLEYFTSDAKITGSKNQELYDEYKKVTSTFVDQDLALIEKKILAYKNQNQINIEDIEEKQGRILRKKYLYTTNFAVNHSDYEIASYLALAEIPNINLKYLDTIQKSLTPKVSKSLYGKKLQELIQERRKTEQ